MGHHYWGKKHQYKGGHDISKNLGSKIVALYSMSDKSSNKKQKIGRRILITLLHELNDIMQLIASPTRN